MDLAFQSPAHEPAFLEGSITCKGRGAAIDQRRGPVSTQSTIKNLKKGDVEIEDDDGGRFLMLSSSLRCINRGLNIHLSISEIRRLRSHNTNKLLQQRKLILVLDLDNTLLHTIDANRMTLEEEYMSESVAAEHALFKWSGMVTKLRPYVRTFLEEASKMFDMYIYTLGTREYALQMATYLDPDGAYFKSKILSREDCTWPMHKGLDVVLGEETAVLILDDNRDVWARHLRNLIPIEAYRYFGLRHGVFNVYGGAPWDSQVPTEITLPDNRLELKLCHLQSIHRLFFNSCVSAHICKGDVRELLSRFLK